MRHQTKRHRIGRTHAHRKATLAAMSTALIEHKRITTTIAKAKALRVFVEPLLNRAKEDSTHNRREVFRRLQSKEAVKELFGDVAGRIGDRPGGFTRVVRLGQRSGDGAELAVIELVDFNETRVDGGAAGGKRRRTRRGSGGTRKAAGTQTAAKATATKVETADQDTGATATVETPVAKEQETPVAERTEPQAEARAAAEEAAAEQGEEFLGDDDAETSNVTDESDAQVRNDTPSGDGDEGDEQEEDEDK